MLKDNVLIFGFRSLKEFFESAFGTKNFSITALFAFLTTINTFITQYIYDDAKAVYFLVLLIAFDAFTGVWKAIKFRIFKSSKLPRILVLMVLYVCILGIAWNAARFSQFYFWLPSVVYGGMIGTLLVSVAENLMILGYIPKGIYYNIKRKIIDSVYFNISSKPKKKTKK